MFLRKCHSRCNGMHRKEDISTKDSASLIVGADETCINKRRINGIACNVLLVTKITSNDDRLDFRRDGCGVWIQKNCKTKIPISNAIQGFCIVPEEEAEMFLWRTTFACKACPTLKKTEVFMRRNDAGSYVRNFKKLLQLNTLYT